MQYIVARTGVYGVCDMYMKPVKPPGAFLENLTVYSLDTA